MKYLIELDTGSRRTGRTTRMIQAAVESILHASGRRSMAIYCATEQHAKDVLGRLADALLNRGCMIVRVGQGELRVQHEGGAVTVRIGLGGAPHLMRGRDAAVIADHHYVELEMERMQRRVEWLKSVWRPVENPFVDNAAETGEQDGE